MPLAIFAANDGTHGVELWATDGTSDGTHLLKDIRPGSTGSKIGDVTRSGDFVYFTAIDDTGFSLWRTDGSEVGTIRLTSVSTTSAELIDHEGTLYFSNGLDRTQLWKSDGSVAGTVSVFNAGAAGAIDLFGSTANGLAFKTADGMLWRSDGTSATTVQVTSIGDVSNDPADRISHNGQVFFIDDGGGVHRTDGTAAGTYPLGVSAPDTPNTPREFVVFNDQVYFLAGGAVFATDGTVAGTRQIQIPGGAIDLGVADDQLFVGIQGSFLNGFAIVTSNGTNGTIVEATTSVPYRMTGSGDFGYFAANARSHNDPRGGVSFAELWRTDGTADGTYLLLDIMTGQATSDPNGLTPFGNDLLFSANDRAHGYEVWITDGTSAGTRLVLDINTVSDPIVSLNASFDRFAELGTPGAGFEVLFAAERSPGQLALWSSDGHSSQELAGFANPPSWLTSVGDKAFFFAENAVWTSSGAGSRPVEVVAVDGELGGTAFQDRFFYLARGEHTFDLLSTDGTSEGTVTVKDFVPPAFDPEFTISGDDLYFKTSDLTKELWVSDGTTAGTYALDVRPHLPANVRELTDVDGTLYFVANMGVRSSDNDHQLVRTDGTTISVVERISNGHISASPMGLTNVGGILYFTVDDGVHGREIWRSDGTEAGTFLVKDISAGSSDPTNLTEAGGKLFFLANDGTGGIRLWVSDGTAGGTLQVPSLNQPIQNLASAGDRVVFAYDDGIHGSELWSSDGTAAGTHLVADIFPGTASPSILNIFSTASYAYFEFVRPNIGVELWRTDGTAAGTERISDGSGPSASSSPYGFTILVEGDGVGTAGPDFISGTPGDDELRGLGGDDVLAGGLGADQLDGGTGSDTVDYSQDAGAVFASLNAGTGQWNSAEGDRYIGIENLIGTAFDDVLVGDVLDNRLDGGNGNDTLYGLGNDNILHGGRGADSLFGGGDFAFDTADYSGNFGAIRIDLAAGTGRWNYAEGDLLASIDNVSGTEFNDVLLGTSGANTLLGNGGDDLIAGGAGADGLAGGAGIDTLSYAGNFGAVEIDLAAGTGLWNYAHGDVVSGFENVIGTSYGDILRGNGDNNRLEGGQGDDQLTGGAGNDHLVGGTGADRLDGGADFDTADYSVEFGGIFVDLLAGRGLWNSAQGDTLVGIDRVIGTGFGDIFWSNGITNYFTGGGGNDEFVFNAGFSHDVITDFQGNGAVAGDTVRFAAGLFTDYNDMIAKSAQVGSDVVITLDAGNVLYLQNTTLASLHSSDFIFG